MNFDIICLGTSFFESGLKTNLKFGLVNVEDAVRKEVYGDNKQDIKPPNGKYS